MHRNIDLSPHSLTKCSAVVSRPSVSDGTAVAALSPSAIMMTVNRVNGIVKPGGRDDDVLNGGVVRSLLLMEAVRYIVSFLVLVSHRSARGFLLDSATHPHYHTVHARHAAHTRQDPITHCRARTRTLIRVHNNRIVRTTQKETRSNSSSPATHALAHAQ